MERLIHFGETYRWEENPCWKYLSRSTSSHRTIKRPQYFEKAPKNTNTDAGRKRKKITNNVTEPVASMPVKEEGQVTNNIIDPVASKPVKEGEITNNVVDPVASQPVIEEGEMSFQDLLTPKYLNYVKSLSYRRM